MDVRRLQFLVRVVETGSITRAAAALHIAQPALSQHIQALERSAGVKLLHRIRDGVTPTEAGMAAYRNAKLIARQLELARTEVRTLAATPAGRVTVGMAPHSHVRHIMQPLLRAVTRQFPEIVLHISENFEGILAEDLRMGRMDMALLYETVPRPGFRSDPVSMDTLCLLGQPRLLEAGGDGLAGTLPMLLPSAVHALRQLVDAVFSVRRTRPLVVAEIESFETLAAAVCQGLGATVLPRSVAADLARDGGLALRPFGRPPVAITLSLSTAEPAVPSAAARAVHALVTALAVDGAQPGAAPRTAARRARYRPPAAPAPGT